MKNLAISALILFCCSSAVHGLEEIGYPRKARSVAAVSYHVPSVFPTIQSAVDAAGLAGGNDITIIVEEGEYREAIVAYGLRNLKLIGRKARILPPREFQCPGLPTDTGISVASFEFINCEHYSVEGFTFVGDDFREDCPDSYPMASAIRSRNSSGIISNNVIFNYFDGICILVDNQRWMKGEITDNYIHNCLWSGIFATGSHILSVRSNKIVFAIPRELSIAVGIWTDDGGIGTISGNQITSYRTVDYFPHKKKKSGTDPWPADFEFMQQTDYQVRNNSFEQSAAAARINLEQMAGDTQNPLHRNSLRIHNHFVNVNYDGIHPDFSIGEK